MSGSSKSKNIKHRKNAQDAKRSREFAKLAKAIRTAVVAAGADPDKNPQLRTAIQDAKKANMPKDNVERAIQSAAGNDGVNDNELQFACYAGGVAIIIDCNTDNTNRTVSHVRAHLRRHNAEIAKPGAVQHIFPERLQLKLPLDLPEEQLFAFLFAFDLDEPEEQPDALVTTCDAEALADIKRYLQDEGIPLHGVTRQRSPQFTHTISQTEYKKLQTWLHTMQENEDIVAVYHNAQPSEP